MNEINRVEYLKEHKAEALKTTFCQIFKDTAMAYPKQAAVCWADKSITYEELFRWARAAARRLSELGVRREEIVAIETGRTAETIAGMLGIWMAGGAYVYLDQAYPESRVEHVLEECRCRFVLNEAWWAEMDRGKEYPEEDRSERDGLALLIYTSGSTSKPKGVMLEHKNVVSAMYNFQIFGLQKGERFGVFPSFSFVASVSDVFSALAAGACVYIVPREIRRSIDALIAYYRKHRIDVTFLPPHMARKLLAKEPETLPLRLLLVGSEEVRNLGKAPFPMLNVYGASETCSLAAYYEINGAAPEGICPVGRIKEGLKGWIVSEDGVPVKPGEEGELWLSGQQISRGYYGMPEITESHYVPNPFSREPGHETVFKTNDIFKELPGGNLQYICRKDNVFKIRGFRVENTGVEHAIMECAPVKEVVVKAFMDSGGCYILCGYFTADERLDVKAVKEKLKEKIPYYMVPTCLIQLDEFPLNANNKIDRKAILPPAELDDHKLLEKLY